uniref:Immunoglobulin C1-set domain-containing protein n=1 Tax=Anguilla anguilla TaxID=7936 RepID=A0A0E9X9N8_ANGAN
MWTVDDGSYEEGITSEPVERNNGIFSVTSLFKVPTAKWKSQSKVACNVKHVSVANGAVPLTKSVSRATGHSIECD